MKVGDKIEVIGADNPCTCIFSGGGEAIFVSIMGEIYGYNGNDLSVVNRLQWTVERNSFYEYKDPTRIPYTMETFEKDRDCWFINGARYKATSYGKNEVYLVSFGLITYKRLYEIFTHEDGSPAGYLEE